MHFHSKPSKEEGTALNSSTFKRARIRLTVLYVVVLVVIIGLFHVVLALRVSTQPPHGPDGSGITLQDATHIASFYYPKKEIRDVKYTEYDHHPYYEIEFDDNTEFLVDRHSGRIQNEGKLLYDPDDFFANYIQNALFLVEIIVLIIGTLLSYFLAGRTLRPIADRIEQQHQFIEDSAHELRNPLAAMRASLEYLLKKKSLAGKETKEVLNMVLEDTVRLSDLTEDLLDLFVYEDKPVPFEEVEIKQVVERVIKRLSPMFEMRKVTITSHLVSFHRRGNIRLLETMFFNVIHNALKFSSDGGEVKVTMQKGGEITVADTGMGMSPEMITSMFKRHHKKGKESGNGLGLSIVQRIASLHGIEVAVSSNAGKGTIFKLFL